MGGIYVASRVHHADMWQDLGNRWPICSTWIDEAGEGETSDLSELWVRIHREIASSNAMVLYVRDGDLPLKGAFIETGMAIACGVPIFAVVNGITLEPRSLRPIGSWLNHPLVTRCERLFDAMGMAEATTKGGDT